MLQVARTIYGEYEGYHNSLDTKEFMSIDSVIESSQSILEILLAYEMASRSPISVTKFGEPQLGKRGLYPTLNFAGQSDVYSQNPAEKQDFLNRMLEIISLSDGTRNLGQIASFLQMPWINVVAIIEILERNHLIVWKD
jgi:aminopeptidase-like protein